MFGLAAHFAVGVLGVFQRVVRVNVAGDHDDGVVGGVPAAIEADGVVAGELLHLMAPADGRFAVRMIEVERRVDLDAEPRARIVLDAHVLLFEDHVALRQHHVVGQPEAGHAVGLERHHRLQLIGGNALIKSGVVVGGECVLVGAGRGDGLRELAAGIFRRALEHQVLEEMGKPRFARHLIGGADLVPDHMRDDRRAVVGNDDKLKAVGERELRDLGASRLGGRRVTRDKQTGEQRAHGSEGFMPHGSTSTISVAAAADSRRRRPLYPDRHLAA